VVSFASMLLMPLLPVQGQLALLALATVGFDLGVQASLISHQTIVFGIAPEARSRLNAILMTSVFIGMAAGGLLGAQALASWGWTGVVGLASRRRHRRAGGASSTRFWNIAGTAKKLKSVIQTKTLSTASDFSIR
jgi:hypothetical protein